MKINEVLCQKQAFNDNYSTQRNECIFMQTKQEDFLFVTLLCKFVTGFVGAVLFGTNPILTLQSR